MEVTKEELDLYAAILRIFLESGGKVETNT